MRFIRKIKSELMFNESEEFMEINVKVPQKRKLLKEWRPGTKMIIWEMKNVKL